MSQQIPIFTASALLPDRSSDPNQPISHTPIGLRYLRSGGLPASLPDLPWLAPSPAEAQNDPTPDEIPQPARQPTLSEVKTLLDNLETTLDFRFPKGLQALRDARVRLVRRYLKSYKPGGDLRHVSQLLNCNTTYAVYSSDDGPILLPYRCKRRDCPVCQDQRRKLWYHRFSRYLSLWTAPKHITLTMQHTGDPLDKQLDFLFSSFAKLRQTRIWRRAKPWGLYTVEITWNDTTSQWHPHLHVIANAAFIPQKLLSRTWSRITDGAWNVGIRAVRSDLASYLSKYIAKSSTMFQAPVDLPTLYAQLHGRRLVNKFGTWPEMPKPLRNKLTFVGRLTTICKRAALGDPEASELLRWILRTHAYALRDTLMPPDSEALYSPRGP